MGRFEFLFLFRFVFCLRPGEAYSLFLNCFYFYFSIRLCLLEAHCVANHCCTSIVLFAIVLSTVASDPSGKNALLLYLENANAPIDTGLSEDEINKIVYGLFS